MIGRDRATIAAFGVAAALVCALTLATPRSARAAPTNAATDTVDGIPCNSLCQAYMAWSDRVMAATRPRPPARPQERMAAHPKKPERPRHPAPDAHHRASMTSAQPPRRRFAAQPPAEIPRLQTAALSDPVTTAAARPFAAVEAITASLADVPAAAASPLPKAMPVSLSVPVAATQAAAATGSRGTGGMDLQFALSLVFGLSLCAFLVIMLLDRSKDRPRAARSFR
jgi:hypothetical protein